jgi:(R)-2-hydroxyglutarate---pyruvate transhydrogenase
MLRLRPLYRAVYTARYFHASTPFPPLRSLTQQDVQNLSAVVPNTPILSTLPPFSLPKDELDVYNTDWMKKYRGSSSTVIKPRSTAEVSQIVRWCWENRVGIVPQGGNTGLVGGSVPLKDELILNLSNMNSIHSFDPVSGLHLRVFISLRSSLDRHKKAFLLPMPAACSKFCQTTC